MARAHFDIEDYPIVVAIDFGTTFSGCAFAYAPEQTDVRTITEWPRQNIQYAKTPTLGLYEKINGQYKMVDWGWKSKLKMDTPAASKYTQVYKFKLHLDETVSLTTWENKIPILTAISDYLRAIHDYSAEKILQQFGPSFSRKKFRYCLTVPAIWSDKAKNVMRQAAVKADIITEDDHPDRLTLVSEPEAAALYCEKKCDQYNLGHGDRFMICDAGGGTVDLIVYEINSLGVGRRLSEVTKGHGASCGSMFIDQNLSKFLAEKVKRHARVDIPKNVLATLVETFAYQVKPHFDGEDEQYLSLPRDRFFDDIDNSGAIGIDGGFLSLKAEELKEKVFEPVVKQVLDLIDQQLTSAKDCSAIFMVGGFGSSNYLLARVKEVFRNRVKMISSPYKPEIAVVCGAVYAGLNPKTVTSRITRRCYGTDILEPFVEGLDPPAYKYGYGGDGPRCRNRFSSFVMKGQKVQVDECVSRVFNFIKQSNFDRYSVTIYALDGNPPRYTTDIGVSKLAEIAIPNPFKTTDPIGHRILHEVKLYFGLNEIKVDVYVAGSLYTSTLRFEGGDSY
ncbi:Heat shock 70 kDa protein 12A [Entomortierella beljakovae]|nr:Heat shock 70 kDa protein 12A [Entomortierella beljakovae]